VGVVALLERQMPPLTSLHTKPILLSRTFRSQTTFSFFGAAWKPNIRRVLSFAMEDRYVAVSLASFEVQQGCKTSLPNIVSPVPNKPLRIETSFAFAFDMISRWARCPSRCAKFWQRRAVSV